MYFSFSYYCFHDFAASEYCDFHTFFLVVLHFLSILFSSPTADGDTLLFRLEFRLDLLVGLPHLYL